MVKIERIFLLMIISVCVVISVTVISTIVDPVSVYDTVFDSWEDVSQPDGYQQTPTSEPDPSLRWNTYRSERFGFEIRYPEDVTRKNVYAPKTINQGLGERPGTPVWQFHLGDPVFYQNTNLDQSVIIINVLHSPEAVSECTEFKPGSVIKAKQKSVGKPPVVDLNGIQYIKDKTSEGTMGQFYETISYRTVKYQACYEITLLMKSSNVDGFISQKVENFPREQVVRKFESVLSTFTFLDTVPEFPEWDREVGEPEPVAKLTSKSSTEYANGIDVSHWQNDINWNEVAGAGYHFAFVKATEGNGFKDWYFTSNIDNGTESGMLVGPYHFARPDLNNTGKEEAEYFLSEVGDYIESGYLRPVLDLEVTGGLGKTALSAWVVEWMETVKSATGVEPLIYTNLNFILNHLDQSVTSYDLWIAYWTCDPTPTYDIPPTGSFPNWSFWQYQAPSACGSYSIPGIEGGVDLNIFNGKKETLGSYTSDAPLWVSLTSDYYQAPIPYYADLSVDVNGDAQGPINYYTWWNCDELGTRISELQTSCGELPPRKEGGCRQNEEGMRCAGIMDENVLAEHTYTDVNDYVAKVVVERENAPPAEDRIPISTINPIVSLAPDQTSPAHIKVGTTFHISLDVRINTSVEGALQAELTEPGSGEIKNQACQEVAGDVRRIKTFDLSVSETEYGLKNYAIWVRYHAGGDCPVRFHDYYDKSMPFDVFWGFPEIDIKGNGISIPDDDESPSIADNTDFGSTFVEAGSIQEEFTIQNVGDADLVLNGSPIVEISGNHAGDFQVTSQPNSILEAGSGTTTFTISFDPSGKGDRYAAVSVKNNDDDENPYNFNILGTGTIPKTQPADFDGDGDTDISVYRPSDNGWYLFDQPTITWGFDGDLPVPGDYDGDGTIDIAVLRPSNGKWYIKDQPNTSWYLDGDVPIPADYDGDGVTDIAVLRESNGKWYINDIGVFSWYRSGDVPVPCDYDGDGADEIAVFRPSNARWYVKGQASIKWGHPNDIPVPADYNGDGNCDMALYRPSTGYWIVREQDTLSWGYPGDIPVPGDYDGDKVTEAAVLRPSTGRWYIMGEGNVKWYEEGDYPLPVRDTNADGDPYH